MMSTLHGEGISRAPLFLSAVEGPFLVLWAVFTAGLCGPHAACHVLPLRCVAGTVNRRVCFALLRCANSAGLRAAPILLSMSGSLESVRSFTSSMLGASTGAAVCGLPCFFLEACRAIGDLASGTGRVPSEHVVELGAV